MEKYQRVFYNGFLSEEFAQRSGVPQGSNLGPLLFIMYFNDIVDSINQSSFELFADDLKIYRVIDTIEDCVCLQNDLNNVAKWCVSVSLENLIMYLTFTTFVVNP